MRSVKAKPMAVNLGSAAPPSTTCAITPDGIETVFRIVFAAEIEARDPRLADALRANIDRLRSSLRVPALVNLDPIKMRAESEELIVALQTAAPLLGLKRPSLQDLIQQ